MWEAFAETQLKRTDKERTKNTSLECSVASRLLSCPDVRKDAGSRPRFLLRGDPAVGLPRKAPVHTAGPRSRSRRRLMEA